MNIQLHKLRADIRAIEEQIREVKTALRSTWEHPMSNEQYTLLDLKARITKLYTLRAWNRGKLHRLNQPESLRQSKEHSISQGFDVIEWDATKHNKEIAEDIAPQYAREEAVAS